MPGGATTTTSSSITTSASHPHALSTLGLGYTVAIALAFLILLSTLLLASYFCYRAHFTRTIHIPSSGAAVVLPQIIFVPDDGNDSDGPAPGLDQAAISSYPKFQYSGGGDGACAICLCEYREEEMLRMMPDCRHCFHLLCLDVWLRLHASCPVCRSSPMPTPLSTPLAEVVPLSQFPAERRRR